MIGVDPCRANHCVSTSPAFTCRASTISNARSPSFSSGTLSGFAISSAASTSSSSPYRR